MIRIQAEDFDPGAVLARLQQDPACGALASFIGTVRQANAGEPVAAIELEHYPGMAERILETIVGEARRRWPIGDCAVIHRVGRLRPGERIVLVAVNSAHRAAAFDACRFIMDKLKTEGPFWKKEHGPDGTRWVAARASDAEAAARWD